jgi:hypothetical protein
MFYRITPYERTKSTQEAKERVYYRCCNCREEMTGLRIGRDSPPRHFCYKCETEYDEGEDYPC